MDFDNSIELHGWLKDHHVETKRWANERPSEVQLTSNEVEMLRKQSMATMVARTVASANSSSSHLGGGSPRVMGANSTVEKLLKELKNGTSRLIEHNSAHADGRNSDAEEDPTGRTGQRVEATCLRMVDNLIVRLQRMEDRNGIGVQVCIVYEYSVQCIVQVCVY
jgi:hypothetical protein